MAEAKRKRSRGYLNSKHVKELSQNKRYTLHRSQGPGEDFDDDEISSAFDEDESFKKEKYFK
jgi:hypothetical protein